MDVGDVPIYLRPGFTDRRKAIDGLVGVIQEQMKMDVLQGCYRILPSFIAYVRSSTD